MSNEPKDAGTDKCAGHVQCGDIVFCGGIVLCGGKSSRMGSPKALLPFGPETMLERVVRLLGEVVEPIVVVAAAGQELPPLPGEVRIVRDRREGRGPLEGIATGLRALPASTLAAEPRASASGSSRSVGVREGGGVGVEEAMTYVTSCDVPLLVPAFVRRMIDLSDGYDIAVPRAEGRLHPLAAVYRASVLPHVEALLAEDGLRLTALLDRVRTRIVEDAELREVDPELVTLRNCNQPEDYRAALQAAGAAESA